MGTPEFSVPVLEALIENYQVVGVVTQPDKEVGRHHEIKPTPVKEVALKNNILVLQPQRIKKEYQEILGLNADLIVTCAYGQMIPKEILDAPKYGCINVHASLLPKLRGGAPIHRAIINNETRTAIFKEDNVGILHDRLSKMGAKLLIETIPDLINGKIKPIPQKEEEVTYAWNIKREEEKIDFNQRTIDIYNQIRGLNPWPGGYALLEGKVVKIYEARISDSFFTTKKNGEIGKIYEDGIGVSTKDGEIIITKLQPSGKRKMLAKEYLNGVYEEDLLGKVFNEE